MTFRGPLLYALILVAAVAGLWAASIPLTGDQKVYLSIALEMRERGEWLIPYLFGAANFLKPPLEYWATLIGWNIFGLSVFGALLPSVLALLGSCYLVNRLFGSSSGLAGLLFAGCLGTMTYGSTAQMEIWIVLFYLASWLQWREAHPYRALILVGVMAWIKGPLYPALWVLSVGLEHFLEKRKWNWKLLLPLALGIAIGLSWYALAARTEWTAMREVFFQRENLGKLETTQGTPGGLWGEFLYSIFPWLPVFILAALSPRSRASWMQQRKFILIYGLLPALFFTFFPYRVNSYLFLLTPIFAFIASTAHTEAMDRREQRVHLFLMGLVSVVSVLVGLLLIRMAQGGWIGLELVIPLIMNLGLWSFLFLRRNWTGFAWVCLMMVNLIRLGAVELGERDLAGLRSYQETNPQAQFAYWISEADIWHEFGLISAAIRQDIARLSQQELAPFLSRSGVLLLNEEQRAMAEELNLPLTCSSWPRLKRRLKFPFRQLLEEGLRVDDSSVIRFFFICKARQSMPGSQ